MRRAILVVFLLAAGCTAPPDDGPAPPPTAPAPTILETLNSIPTPTFDRVAAVTRWESFVTQYGKRDWRLPHNEMAAKFLAAELEGAGYEADVIAMPSSFGPSQAPIPADMYIVRGVLQGKNDSHRFALVAHYDTITTTGQGAYDDGAGTMAQLEICKLLAAQKAILNHTVECLFFDAEEAGLKASKAFVAEYQANPHRGYVYDLAFGYDMTGINWPGHEWNLFAMIGTQSENLTDLGDPFHNFLDVAYDQFLETGPLPGAAQGIQVLDVHDRNSDEQNFKKADIPVVRFAGGRNAADYPMYHQPGDTIPYVYYFVGGRPNFEKGIEAVVLTSYYTILGFDAYDPWNLPMA